MPKSTKIVEDPKDLRQMCLQVKLRRGNESRVTWANADRATLGREVKVEEDDGTWSEGWIVDEVHGPPVSQKIIQHRSHDYTRQRKSSDI